MKSDHFMYWSGAMIGCFVGFGFNVMINYGTYIGKINLIFASVFCILWVILIINQIRILKEVRK